MSRLACRTAVVETPFLDLADDPDLNAPLRRFSSDVAISKRRVRRSFGRTRVLREHVGTVAVRPPLNESAFELVANALRHR